VLGLAACSLLGPAVAARPDDGAATAFRYVPRAYGPRPSVDQLSALGPRIFFDTGLSASRKVACGTCHRPTHAFGPPNGASVQPGGADMRAFGTRSVPTLRYVQTTIPFREHFIDDDDAGGQDAGPTGGLTWDGRADSPHAQARLPLLASNE